jgi:hypothetical protein
LARVQTAPTILLTIRSQLQEEEAMLFDRARLRVWFARKDPFEVALELATELRSDIRALQRRLAEVPATVAASRATASRARSSKRTRNGGSPSRPVGRKRRTTKVGDK